MAGRPEQVPIEELSHRAGGFEILLERKLALLERLDASLQNGLEEMQQLDARLEQRHDAFLRLDGLPFFGGADRPRGAERFRGGAGGLQCTPRCGPRWRGPVG